MILWSRRQAIGISAALVVGALAGCTPATPASPADNRLTAAVSFYPFEFVVNRVGGDQVKTSNLTTPGSEPHDLELTPHQVGELATSDLVVYQSGFQPAVDAAVAQDPPRRKVDAADFVRFLPATAEAPDAKDPHTWLDPTNLAAVAVAVRDQLIAARPEAAAEFTANTEALLADLNALDQELSNGLANCERRTFVTSHAAFAYLADRYRLDQVGIRGIEPDAEPSAARIAEVQQIAKKAGVTTIFFETLVSPVVAEAVARDLGLVTDVLDPLEGITDDSRGRDYLEVMRANLAALKKANSCS